eukprot:5954751-Pyramimonas_sp.AAC.1
MADPRLKFHCLPDPRFLISLSKGSLFTLCPHRILLERKRKGPAGMGEGQCKRGMDKSGGASTRT